VDGLTQTVWIQHVFSNELLGEHLVMTYEMNSTTCFNYEVHWDGSYRYSTQHSAVRTSKFTKCKINPTNLNRTLSLSLSLSWLLTDYLMWLFIIELWSKLRHNHEFTINPTPHVPCAVNLWQCDARIFQNADARKEINYYIRIKWGYSLRNL
jgi:hypothetical protein